MDFIPFAYGFITAILLSILFECFDEIYRRRQIRKWEEEIREKHKGN